MKDALETIKAPHTIGKVKEFTRSKLVENYSQVGVA